MYLLIQSRRMRLAAHDNLAVMFSVVIAEAFDRFRLFTLGWLAFLATWYAVRWALNKAQKLPDQRNWPQPARVLLDHEDARRAETRPAEPGYFCRG